MNQFTEIVEFLSLLSLLPSASLSLSLPLSAPPPLSAFCFFVLSLSHPLSLTGTACLRGHRAVHQQPVDVHHAVLRRGAVGPRGADGQGDGHGFLQRRVGGDGVLLRCCCCYESPAGRCRRRQREGRRHWCRRPRAEGVLNCFCLGERERGEAFEEVREHEREFHFAGRFEGKSR